MTEPHPVAIGMNHSRTSGEVTFYVNGVEVFALMSGDFNKLLSGTVEYVIGRLADEERHGLKCNDATDNA